MANVKTPASIAAAANALIPLVGALDASGDPDKQAQASELGNDIQDALTKACHLAAEDVIALLGNKTGPAAQLQKLDQQAQTAAQKIAKDESQVANAISFCTTAVKFVGAVATGNVVAAGTQLANMLQALHIS